MTGPEHDAQLPRDASPVTATQANDPTSRAGDPDTAQTAADGHTRPQPDHAAGRCSCGRRPGPAEPDVPQGRTAILADDRRDSECGECGDPLEPCPCEDPCGKTYCFGCDDIEQLHPEPPKGRHDRWQKAVADDGTKPPSERRGIIPTLQAVADAEQDGYERAIGALNDANKEHCADIARLRAEQREAIDRIAQYADRAIANGQEADRLTGERDRARGLAVTLENQLAAVSGLHVDSYTSHGIGRGNDTPPDYWTAYCEHDNQDWPCPTVRTLNATPDADR
jgi:hypothetical protein